MRLFRRKLKKSVSKFWTIWVIAWIIANIIMSGMGMTYSHGVIYYFLEGCVSCLVAYIMTKSRIFKVIVYVYLIIELVGCHDLVGVICFAMNVWLARKTAKLCG